MEANQKWTVEFGKCFWNHFVLSFWNKPLPVEQNEERHLDGWACERWKRCCRRCCCLRCWWLWNLCFRSSICLGGFSLICAPFPDPDTVDDNRKCLNWPSFEWFHSSSRRKWTECFHHSDDVDSGSWLWQLPGWSFHLRAMRWRKKDELKWPSPHRTDVHWWICERNDDSRRNHKRQSMHKGKWSRWPCTEWLDRLVLYCIEFDSTFDESGDCWTWPTWLIEFCVSFPDLSVDSIPSSYHFWPKWPTIEELLCP